MLRDPQHDAGWTDERIASLKKHWLDGLSATQIASMLGGGVTRNGVIGKVHRLKLTRRMKSATKVAAPSRQVERQKKRNGNAGQPKSPAIMHRIATAKPLPDIDLPEDGVDVTHLLGILQLNDHTCRWPVMDDGAETKFCGADPQDGSRYCAMHYRRSTVS